MAQTKISEIKVNLWDKYKVTFEANPDVNIIVGINGSGKTTLLAELHRKTTKASGKDSDCIYIPSTDNLTVRDGRKKMNALSQDLNYYIYDLKDGPSLFHYRVSALDAPASHREKIDRRVKDFCNLIDSLFKDSGKSVIMENNKFFIESEEGRLSPDDLSSGEKQLLLILLRIFLLNESDSIVMIDEPENSLDISWQYKLIDILVKLNPNAQFFITTHSPSIFGDGWEDRIIYMEDVTTKIQQPS